MTTNTTITAELLDQLLANYEKPEDLTGDDGLFKQLKKALIERACRGCGIYVASSAASISAFSMSSSSDESDGWSASAPSRSVRC